MCKLSRCCIFKMCSMNRLQRSVVQPGPELPPVRPRCPTFTPAHSQLQQTGSAYKCIPLSAMGWHYGAFIGQPFSYPSFAPHEISSCLHRSTMSMACMEQRRPSLWTSTSTWPRSWQSSWPSCGRQAPECGSCYS